MARYNSISSTSSVAGGSTINTPASGLLTTLTGSGTVTIPNPVLYTGQTQTFYNSTGAAIVLSTPSGNFIVPGIASATSISIPAGSIFTAVSDGANYLVQAWVGGVVSTANLVATGGTINGINIGATTTGTGAFSTLNVTSTTTLAGMTATTGAFSGISTFTNNASASSSTTGAIQVTGGAGIGGSLYVGGSSYVVNATNPTRWVSVDNALTTQSMYMQVNTASSDTRIGSYTNHALGIYTNNTVRMTVDTSGRVGIGTAPGRSFHVKGNDNWWKFEETSGAGRAWLIGTGTTTSFRIYDETVNQDRFAIDSTGNVGIGTTGPAVSLDISTRTDAIALPKGTTAQRPASPAAGYTRFNSSTNFAEYYTGTQWAQYGSISPTTVAYLIVAGGGGGAGSEGGGGGAGGVLQNASQSVTPGTVYNITVGTGGTGNTNPGGDGTSSTLFGLTAVGGGGGGSVNSNNARAGGSGGGGGRTSTTRTFGGAGTGGQGNTGGTGFENQAGYAAAGGGGASAVGGNGTGLVGGNGGAGVANQISGSVIGQLSSSTYYVGGGGGAGGGNNNGNPSSGTGGLGGGGNGGLNAGSATGGVAGTPYTGGGGGGGGQGNTGANGGSGVVVIAYPSGYKDAVATGTYARTVNAGNTIYTFTGTGSITF